MAVEPLTALGLGDPAEPISEVVLPLDGSATALRAAPLAEEFAARAGVPLVVFSVVPNRELHERHATELRRSLDRVGVTADRIEVHGGPSFVDTLTASIERGGVVCMTGSAIATASEVAFGSTTADVVEHTRHTTVIVGPHTDLLRCRRIRRLVLAVHDHADAAILAATARVWATAMSLGITVVEVAPPDGTLPDDASESTLVRRVAEELHRADPSIPVDFEVLHDRHVERALLSFVREMPGAMLAVSTHGFDATSGLRLSSTSRRVLAHSDVPLLVVHAPDAR